MALNRLKGKDKKRLGKLLVILGLAVFGALVWFLSGDDATLPSDTTTITERENIKEINLNTTFLNNERLNEFNLWNSLPLEVGETGKTNPFSR